METQSAVKRKEVFVEVDLAYGYFVHVNVRKETFLPFLLDFRISSTRACRFAGDLYLKTRAPVDVFARAG